MPYLPEEQDKPIHLSYHRGQEIDCIVSGHMRFAYEGHVEELGPGDVLMYDSGRGAWHDRHGRRAVRCFNCDRFEAAMDIEIM